MRAFKNHHSDRFQDLFGKSQPTVFKLLCVAGRFEESAQSSSPIVNDACKGPVMNLYHIRAKLARQKQPFFAGTCHLDSLL